MIFCRNVDCIRSSTTSSELPEKTHGATTQKWIENISASMFLIQNLTFFPSLSSLIIYLQDIRLYLKKWSLNWEKRSKLLRVMTLMISQKINSYINEKKYQFLCISIFKLWLFLSAVQFGKNSMQKLKEKVLLFLIYMAIYFLDD